MLLYRLGVLQVVDRLRTSRIRPDFIPETPINTFMIQTAANLEKINITATSIPTFDPGNSCPLSCESYRWNRELHSTVQSFEFEYQWVTP